MNKWLMVILCAVVLAGCGDKVDESKVVAKVGKTVYSVDDVNAKIDGLDPQLKEYFTKKENRVRLLDQLIEEEVIYQLAKKDGVARSKDFKTTMNDLERQAMINFYIQQKVDGLADVTKTEVEAFYNDNADQFSSYESRNLSHILMDNKDDAQRVLGQLRNGGDFASLAQKNSVDPSKAQGGQLGWVRKSQLVPEFANAAFALTNKSRLSGVVKTQFGYHIIRYNDSRVVPQQSLDAVYGQISNQLLAQKKRQRFDELLKSGKETVKIERSIENL